MAENRKLMLKNVRLSYANLFEPRSIVDGGVLKYSTAVLIEKTDKAQIKAIGEIVNEIINEQKWTAAQKKSADIALRDGDTEKPEEEPYQGVAYLNAKSNRKPLVVDQKRQVVDSEDIVYSGCYANVMVSFYPYDNAGNKGVGVGLLAVQKVRDGEPLGNTVTADIFDDIDDGTGDKNPFDFI